jgi:hypothetical protein
VASRNRDKRNEVTHAGRPDGRRPPGSRVRKKRKKRTEAVEADRSPGPELFGARWQLLSGSSGQADRTRSDSTHPSLFIETKLQATSAVRRLWERARDQARRESRTPVLILYAKGKPGGLIVVHQNDLAAVAVDLDRSFGAASRSRSC